MLSLQSCTDANQFVPKSFPTVMRSCPLHVASALVRLKVERGLEDFFDLLPMFGEHYSSDE